LPSTAANLIFSLQRQARGWKCGRGVLGDETLCHADAITTFRCPVGQPPRRPELVRTAQPGTSGNIAGTASGINSSSFAFGSGRTGLGTSSILPGQRRFSYQQVTLGQPGRKPGARPRASAPSLFRMSRQNPPPGYLQVTSRERPVSSLIIDLAPSSALPRPKRAPYDYRRPASLPRAGHREDQL